MTVGYQPVWRDGTELRPGRRPSADRYAMIRTVLDMSDVFTLIDVGAYTGYFAHRVAADYPLSRVTAVDNNPGLSATVGVSVIPQRLTPTGLRQLPRHDIVLALSVLHHFPDWRRAFTELRACRSWAIVETPHPDEDWMRHAPARHRLGDLHDMVAAAGTLLGRSPRHGGGHTYMRPVYTVAGTVHTHGATIFTGSGNNQRSIRRYADDKLRAALGYDPYPGSLNMRTGPVDPGAPTVVWSRTLNGRRRAYDAWRAWYADVPGHVMIPRATRAHRNTLEGWAAVRLRDRFNLADGDRIAVDIEYGV